MNSIEQAKDKTQLLEQIDSQIAEYETLQEDLIAQIASEEQKTGITDKSHFAYSSFAKAVRNRHDDLNISIADLRKKRIKTEAALKEDE